MMQEFRCRRCGNCCFGPGYVNVSDVECHKIAEFLGLPDEEFIEKYTALEPGHERWLINAEGEEQLCIFLQRNGAGQASCRIQGEAKPDLCKGFPITWRKEGMEAWCEGFNEEKTNQ